MTHSNMNSYHIYKDNIQVNIQLKTHLFFAQLLNSSQ